MTFSRTADNCWFGCGWVHPDVIGLLFHSDLLYGSPLAEKIKNCSILPRAILETWWKKTPAREPMKSYCFTSSRWPNIGWRTQTTISIMAYNFGFHYPSTSPELSNALQGKVYHSSETRCTTTTCWTDIQYYGPHKIVRRLFQPPTDILWDVKKNLVRSLYKT